MIEGIEFDKEGNKFLILSKDGKAIEYYDNGTIQFELEYLNRKRWNGIGYNYFGEKIFEIKNGKGKSKLYNFKGKLLFEGEFIKGQKNGKGK